MEDMRLFLNEDEWLKHIQEEMTYLTRTELGVLYEWIQWQYISYENVPLLDLIKKIRLLLDK